MMRSNKDVGAHHAEGSHDRMGMPPEVGLLSNGRTLVTEAGAGYASRFDLDVTRWREDGTRDCWGQFCYVRDLADNKIWSVGGQPIHRTDCIYEHSFQSDRAELRCSTEDIDIRSSICVVTDCDAEVRLLRISNLGSKAKELELTSYSEICLNNRRADSAHPAFAKLEAILGIRREGQLLSVDPCNPADWPGYELDFEHGSATHKIHVDNKSGPGHSLLSLVVDGKGIDGSTITLSDDGRRHDVRTILGSP
ncbi:hypothetical protein HJB86_29585 [Rhizobium sp. NZLR3b]|jgi:cellobiose phosphorylase|nr:MULTISPECIES: hypothetical protein [unclassified Rhizobium]MBX5183144.1 hypothetical protein [Rhizobium sp. NZLR5]MBX5192994.1 hypothetical protein [Rhizobium sp. NZLR3b]